MIEKDVIISDDKEVSETFNKYFVDIVKNLDIEPLILDNEDEIHSNDPLDYIVKKYSKHDSILKIKEYVTIEEKFSFSTTTTQEFQNQIDTLDPKKATVENDIPTKILNISKEITSSYLTNLPQVISCGRRFTASYKLR